MSNLSSFQLAISPLAQRYTGSNASVLEPATGDLLAGIRFASLEDVNRTVDEAVEAQASWAQLTFDKRAAVLRRAAELLKERKDDFNLWNIRECGSILPKAQWEIDASYEQLHAAAALSSAPHGYLIPSAIAGRTNMWKRVPLGVIGVITPWNYPLLLAMRSVAPALALGNAVVLKPALQGVFCGGFLIEEIFRDAGMPEGVFRVLPGEAEVGDAIVRDPRIAMVSFTGSTQVGRKIGETCGGLLKKVALELGGNNAFVVLDDADIEQAASHGAWAAFLHQGQICMQAGRHLVHESVAKHYAEALTRHAKGLVVGDPNKGEFHLGPLISMPHHAKVTDIVKRTIAQGGQVLTGGGGQAPFFEPTVIDNIKPGMAAFDEEIFGPVAPLTTFSSDDDLVSLINQSSYGLSASIHTKDIARGLSISHQLRTGMVHINDQTVNAEFNVPFGGMGFSGNGGRFGGPVNAEEFTQSQWVSMVSQPAAYPF